MRGASIRRFSSVGGDKKTALYDWHVAQGAKMVSFAGWSMPIVYNSQNIVDSHMHTRKAAGLFDVSHMAQMSITGPDRNRFLESLTVIDLSALPPSQGSLSLFTNEQGGIIDDTVITNLGDSIYLVLNAGCADKDIAHIKKHAEAFDVEIGLLDQNALLALQGPKAASVLATLLDDASVLDSWGFMSSQTHTLLGKSAYITRCGYTGEDGFEISVPNGAASELADALVAHDDVKPIGLGARDTLRTESGLCLYGNDIDEETTPIEGSLLWTIAKSRREASEEHPKFPGFDIIMNQQNEKAWTRKRVGIKLTTRRVPAPHSPVFKDIEGEPQQVGEVTSGTLSPVLGVGIGMAYMNCPYNLRSTDGLYLLAKRNKKLPLSISKMPFVPTNYKKD